jgi:RND family efflux transporter MFP subunit
MADWEARLAEAKAQLERAAPLTKKGYVSESTFDVRQAAKRTAEAQLAAARSGVLVSEAELSQLQAQRRNLEWRLSRTDLKAPVSGYVSRRTARIGDVASSTRDALFRIVANGEIELEATVPETKLAKLAAGQTAIVSVAGEAPRTATLRLVSPEIDTATRLGRVRLLIHKPDGLKTGGFGRAEIATGSSRGLGVPASALLYGTSGTTVQRVVDGTVRAAKVTTGLMASGMTEIRTGLTERDIVVTKAGTFLRDGDKVRAILPKAELSEAN